MEETLFDFHIYVFETLVPNGLPDIEWYAVVKPGTGTVMVMASWGGSHGNVALLLVKLKVVVVTLLVAGG